LESLLVERICGPLQMDSTRFNLTPELESRRAFTHNQLGYALPMTQRPALQPLAGLYSTANDMLKFVSALERSRFDLAPINAVTQNGRLVTTGGGLFGSCSLVCCDKVRHRGVVILSTTAAIRSDFGEFLIASQWRSDRRPVPAKISSDLCEGYVGHYRPISEPARDRSGGGKTNSPASIGIRRHGERLFAQVLDPGSRADWMPPLVAELVPEPEDRFFERLTGRPGIFTRDKQGKVTGLRTNYRGQQFAYTRISNQPPKGPEPLQPRIPIKLDTKQLDGFVGDYEFPPERPQVPGSRVSIRREGEQLTGQVWGPKALKGAFDIFPETETNFFLKLDGSQFIFVKNEQGEVTALFRRSPRQGAPDSSHAKKLSTTAR
jgi:hypothetical protein